MIDFKLKLMLSILSGVLFSFILILLAFAVPLKEKKDITIYPKGKLEKISNSVK